MPRRSVRTGRRWGSAKQKAALKKAQLISARERKGTGDLDGGSNRRRRAASMNLLKATVRANVESDYLDRSHASNAKGKGFLKGHEVASRRLGAANIKRDQARTKLDIEHSDRRGKAVAAYQDRQARVAEARKAQIPSKPYNDPGPRSDKRLIAEGNRQRRISKKQAANKDLANMALNSRSNTGKNYDLAVGLHKENQRLEKARNTKPTGKKRGGLREQKKAAGAGTSQLGLRRNAGMSGRRAAR